MAFAMGTPLLDACVLAVLAGGDAYGYSLTHRRYYAITPVGRTCLDARRVEWKEFRGGVDELLKEESEHG